MEPLDLCFSPIIFTNFSIMHVGFVLCNEFTKAVDFYFHLRGTNCSWFMAASSNFVSKIPFGEKQSFGDEFRAARKASEEVGAQIVLGDRPIEITDKELDAGPFQLYDQLSKSYPSLLQPLIYQRDAYPAWSLKRSKAVNGSKRVVGVLGNGHLNGLVYSLISDVGDLRFRDLAGDEAGGGSNGWMVSFLKSLLREGILGFMLWAFYELLKHRVTDAGNFLY
ncbi:hypothetical protein HPP92_020336 [Vanilla planifolia]|uniref:TraB domain-containing protein n=1 Tax=Vanilla planifolia TaxID=51239 RepID=A0A835Q7I6_VANPL|nr:hypothetical protein HPP92_020336 [Vanilla planifolia]